MKHFLYSFLSIACIIPAYGQWFNRQGPDCSVAQSFYGFCTTLSFCPEAVNVFRTQNRRVAEQYVFALQRACGTRNINGDPLVCCRSPAANNNSPNFTPETTENDNFFFPTEETRITRPTSNPRRNPFLPSSTTIAPRRETTTRQTTAKERMVTAAPVNEKSGGSFCRGPDAVAGSCMALEVCPELLDRLRANPKDEDLANFLRESNRICGNSGSTVCCPRSEVETTTAASFQTRSNVIPRRLPTVDDGCGYSKSLNRKIVGGQVAKKGAWPWAVLLGYDTELSASPFKCGGALITARHVLTAAHCIRKDLSFVRLGEYNLTTEMDTKHIDIPIVRKEVNPKYDRRDGHSDIALLYMERNVDFSDFIKPICLPTTTQQRFKSYVGHNPFVVGWGRTMEGGRSSDILQELQITVFDNEVCIDSYRELKRLFSEKQFNSAVVCAGVLAGGHDTCQGDSGGPLMVPELTGSNENTHFYLIGVVSYGVGCARVGVPGVYTSVSYFIDWIVQKVADTV